MPKDGVFDFPVFDVLSRFQMEMDGKRMRGWEFTFEPKAQHPSASHSSETPPGIPDRSATDRTADRTANKSTNSNDAGPPASRIPAPLPCFQFPPTSPQYNSPAPPTRPDAQALLAVPVSLLFSSRSVPARRSSKSA